MASTTFNRNKTKKRKARQADKRRKAEAMLRRVVFGGRRMGKSEAIRTILAHVRPAQPFLDLSRP